MLLAGMAVLVLASHLPFPGGLVRAIAVLAGTGLLLDRARAAWVSIQRLPAREARARRSASAGTLPDVL